MSGNRGFDKVGILVIGCWPGFLETLVYGDHGNFFPMCFGVADFEQDRTCWDKRKLPRSSMTAPVCLFALGPRERALVACGGYWFRRARTHRWFDSQLEDLLMHLVGLIRERKTLLKWICDYFVSCLAYGA